MPCKPPKKPAGSEKFEPDYSLSALLTLIKQGHYLIAKPAQDGISDLKLTTKQAVAELLLAETHGVYYKSVTCKWDAKTWQDVYHLQTSKGEAYIKMYVDGESGKPPKLWVVIVSYKPLDDGYWDEKE